MSGHLFDKYGAILQEDVEVLESCLTLIASKCHAEERFPRILEIGMHDGGTLTVDKRSGVHEAKALRHPASSV